MEPSGSIAHELITRGWTQGRGFDSEGRVCLLGAAAFAYGMKNGEPWAMPLRIRRILDELCGDFYIFWNDEPSRTFDEVLRVAKEADEILDAQREAL